MTRPKHSVAELPSGGPTNKGLPLDPGIPGTSTFSKPVNDIREPESKDDSIHRVDDANSITKNRDRIDTNEDNADQNTSFNGLGDSEATSKTKYPYRDGAPNAHNASTTFLAEMWKLEVAHSSIVTASVKTVVVMDKKAATVEQVLKGLDKKFEQRSRACKVILKRADLGNLRWIFAVDCGNGPKAVKLKALTDGRIRHFNKVDVEVSCSCLAWQWLGPEYHAKGEDFILGKHRGTAAEPNIRDPERDNRVCKHVAAALAIARGWTLPKPNSKLKKALKKASSVRKAIKRAAARRDAFDQTAKEILSLGLRGRILEWEGAPYAFAVRARTTFGKYEYQFKKASSESWPHRWVDIRDPASWVGRLGLDHKWSSLSVKMREQLMRAV